MGEGTKAISLADAVAKIENLEAKVSTLAKAVRRVVDRLEAHEWHRDGLERRVA